MGNHVTTTDVALHAGVSQTTVSRVLNHSSRINGRTREIVLKAMKELGYRTPSKTSRGNIIALVMCPLPEQKNPLSLEFFGGIITGIQEVIEDEELELMLFTLKPNTETLPMSRARLDSFTGMILVGDPSEKLLESIREQNINCVQFTPRGERHGFQNDTVGPNKIAADLEAANYLIGLGYKRFGVIMAERFSDRLLGIRTALQMHGLKLREEDFYLLKSTDNSDFADAAREFIRRENPPKALIVGFYNAALVVKSILESAGIHVPEDVLIFTYGFSEKQDQFPMLYEDPRLYGVKAAHRLLEKRRYPDDPPQHIVINMQLITKFK